jgi:hypothetical protein
VLYREIIAVCSQIHTKHTNTLCGQNVELLNVELAVYKGLNDCTHPVVISQLNADCTASKVWITEEAVVAEFKVLSQHIRTQCVIPCTPRRIVSFVIRNQCLLITAFASWVSRGTDEHHDHGYIGTLVEDLRAVTMNATCFRYMTPCTLAKIHRHSVDCPVLAVRHSWEAVLPQISFR